jgi:branched-chain amino acid transport system substrate-binding protein
MKTSILKWGVAAAFAAATLASGAVMAQTKEVVIGFQIDRTGPTQNIGVPLAVGYNDYVNLINSKGGVEGYKIKVSEVDNEYKVPPAVEGYERQKKDGAVLISFFGTASTLALIPKTTEDKIPGMSPGFGSAASANGKTYPYTFLMAASYWSQAAGAVMFAKDQLGGVL